MPFPVHTVATAPSGSRPMLERLQAALGFVPNLYAVLAESPAALQGLLALEEALGRSGLTPTEQEVVLLTVSTENECAYCVAAHSTVAAMKRVPPEVVRAVRSGTPIADRKLAALRDFTRAVVRDRGRVAPAEVEAFLAAGYSPAQLLAVVLGVAMKTLSNYANHLTDTPLDAAFQPQAWATRAA